MERPLGRRPAPDERHLRRFSLSAESLPILPTPVVVGTNWHRGFDTPRRIGGAYWVGSAADLDSPVRGGHCYCLRPPALRDIMPWWDFYNQGHEGACVGFGISRMMTLLNRRRYDARWLYHEAQKVDEWPGEEDTGTSVRAGCDVARDLGLWRSDGIEATPADGITTNRWALSVEDIAACLDPASGGRRVIEEGYVTLLNSWGRGFPHLVRMDLETLHHLVFVAEGEATVVTDR